MKINTFNFSTLMKTTVIKIVLITILFMSATYNWNNDYQKSLIEDNKVLAAFSAWGYTGEHVDSTVKNSDYDAILRKGDKTYTIEIKNDWRAAGTQNFFVETGNANGKPSGLTTSKASHTVFTMPQNNILLALKTEDLRALINDNDFREMNKPTMGVLIPVTAIANSTTCVTKTYKSIMKELI